jgi:hypothetical protein
MALRRTETIGRPLGDPQFEKRISAALARDPAPRKRGRRAGNRALSP